MISERSLEMNVNENLVNSIRKFGGIFSKAFIYGFSLREEALHGFDTSISLPLSNLFLFALQYKKPETEYNNIYRFMINKNHWQHIILLISSIIYQFNVWYVFPLFIDTSELSRNSPNFLKRTFFARVVDFPLTTFDNRPHRVEIDLISGRAYVFSDEGKEVKIYNGGQFLEEIRRNIIPTRVKEIVHKKYKLEDVKRLLKEHEVYIDWGILDKLESEERNFHKRFTSGFFASE